MVFPTTSKLYAIHDVIPYDGISTCLEALRKAGKDNKSIRGTVMSHYRDLYKQAFRDNDKDTMKAIKYGMMYLDLGDQSFTEKTFEDWENAVRKE